MERFTIWFQRAFYWFGCAPESISELFKVIWDYCEENLKFRNDPKDIEKKFSYYTQEFITSLSFNTACLKEVWRFFKVEYLN